MALLTRKRKILAKLEAVYGTDSLPVVANDAVLLRSITPTPLSITYDERTLVRPFIGGFQQVVGMKMVKLEMEMEMAGFGSVGPAAPTPGYDALIRACAFQRVVTAGVSVVYSPVSATPFDSITIYYEKDGVLQKALGCRGTMTLSMAAGKIPSYKFTMTGVYGGVADTNIGTPITSAYQLPRAVNAQNTTGFNVLGLATGVLRSFSLDLGNKVDFTSYPGDVEIARISDRAIIGKMSVQATSVAAMDWLTQVLNVDTGGFALTHGPAANMVALAGPAVQLTNPTETDDNGIAYLDFDLRFLPVNGNDELTISIK